MRTINKILAGTILSSSILLLTACVVVVKNPDGTPVTRNTTTSSSVSTVYWYYYPNVRAYYHLTERYYYYPDGSTWRKARELPHGWVVSKNDRVLLKLAGMPYVQHAHHQQKYPAKYNAAVPPANNNHRGWGYREQVDNHAAPATPENEHAAQGHANGKQGSHGKVGFAEKVKADLNKFGKPDAPGQAKRDVPPPGHNKSENSVPPGHAKFEEQTSPGHVKHDKEVPPGHAKADEGRGNSRQHEDHGRNDHTQNVHADQSQSDNGKGKSAEHGKPDNTMTNRNKPGKQTVEQDNGDAMQKGTPAASGDKRDMAADEQRANQQSVNKGGAQKQADRNDEKANKGKANKQAKSSPGKGKDKQKDNNGGQPENQDTSNQGNEAASDADQASTDEKVVELDISNKGKGKSK